MALMIRQIAAGDTLDTHLCLDALAQGIPPATVATVLTECGATAARTRQLPALVTLVCGIAMTLDAADDLAHVFRHLVAGLRWLWPDPAGLRVSKGALCQARYRLGARPLALLFRRVCHPLATPATPGAFLFGLRLMALDGTTLAVPDTPANVHAFGRQAAPRGTCAWPRVQVVARSECGTHAICDAGVWRWDADERAAGRRLLRSVGRGVLLLWDRGCHRCTTIAATPARGAHFLGRLPATDKPLLERTLADGTQLVRLRPGDSRRRRRGETVLVRRIRSTLDDPGRPGHAAEHRLITALLNPRVAPAEELVVALDKQWNRKSGEARPAITGVLNDVGARDRRTPLGRPHGPVQKSPVTRCSSGGRSSRNGATAWRLVRRRRVPPGRWWCVWRHSRGLGARAATTALGGTGS